jgi:hypothetical protein
MAAEVSYLFLSLRTQIKIYHWQTLSYARHIASNDLLAKLDVNLDQFVEVYIGKYGRPKFGGKTANIHLVNFHDKDAPELIRNAIDWLENSLPKKLKKTDTDLLNIRDTIVADLNQVLYLFTLKQ